MVAAARSPSSRAASQCSARGRTTPSTRTSVASPIARTAGFEVTWRGSTMTPRSVANPAACASDVSGTMPRARTARSTKSSLAMREVRDEPGIGALTRRLEPLDAALTHRDAVYPVDIVQPPGDGFPKACESGGEAMSTSVTSAPSPVSVEVTSAPISPAPTTRTRVPGLAAARSRSASSTVRSTWTRSLSAPGIAGRRGSTARGDDDARGRQVLPSSVSTTPSPGRSAAARVRVSRRTSWSSYHSGSSSAMSVSARVPARYSLLRGGRSSGCCASSTRVISPEKPPDRRAAAVLTPPIPAPTMTTCCGTPMPCEATIAAVSCGGAHSEPRDSGRMPLSRLPGHPPRARGREAGSAAYGLRCCHCRRRLRSLSCSSG